MVPKSTVFERYSDPTPLLIFGSTAGLLFVEGLALAYQAHLSEVLSQTLSLSIPGWTAYILGPFLIAPVLLFGVLYTFQSRSQQTPSVTALLPGVAVAVLIGSLSGQYVGVALWPIGGRTLPILALFSARITVFSPYGLQAWFVLIEPLVYDLLVTVAALAYADVGPMA